MTAKRDIKIDYTSLCTNIIRVILQSLPISGCRMAMTYDLQISSTARNEFSTKQTFFKWIIPFLSVVKQNDIGSAPRRKKIYFPTYTSASGKSSFNFCS